MFHATPQEGKDPAQEADPFAIAVARLYATPTRGWGPDDDDDPDGNNDDDADDDDDANKGAGAGKGKAQGATDDPDELKAELASTRREAAKHRKALRALEAKVAEGERKGMSELDQAKTAATAAEERAAKAETALRTRTLGDKVADEAGELGFHKPAKAVRHIDTDGLMDDDGEVDLDAVRKRLRAALKDEPYLGGAAKSGGADGGQGRKGTQGDAGSSVNDAIRRAARGKVAAG